MTAAESTHTWVPAPDGPLVRGTVILLPGRGEHGGVYERFGRRLALDAYVVHALDSSADDELGAVSYAVGELVADAAPGVPVVLAGSDTGALQALALILAELGGVKVDGLLLVGLPDSDTDIPAPPSDEDEAAWDHELAARTSCPTHRARLSADVDFGRGSLSDPVPSHLAAVLSGPRLEDVAVPVLLLHGGADSVAAVDIARGVAARLPHAELAVTTDGRHDVLNDIMHRTVAAEVVQWLERLRGGPELAPLISVESRQNLALAR
ncbi:alpha/beta hydrolase [Catenulispora rubra]|uniref:alpha/beta hydrolase n=1 Tax=Catenulispora rubra TaxID=280293 RepID=UPI0018921874|nr:lysophospholipase [Catenulispora rubra]